MNNVALVEDTVVVPVVEGADRGAVDQRVHRPACRRPRLDRVPVGDVEGSRGAKSVEAKDSKVDDGNNVDTDSCINCVNATCGDDIIWAGEEDCEDGNDILSDACVNCKNATCGDG